MSLLLGCDYYGCKMYVTSIAPIEVKESYNSQVLHPEGWRSLAYAYSNNNFMHVAFHFCPEHAKLISEDQWLLRVPKKGA